MDMIPIPPSSLGWRIVRRLAIVSPPRLSLQEGRVVLDSRALLPDLERLHPRVREVAFSSDPAPSPREEEMMRSMRTLLVKGAHAVATVRPVSEAVKVVEDGWVVGSLDRTALVSITLPIIVDRSALSRLLSVPGANMTVDPIQELIKAGGAVRVVSSLT